MLAQDDKIGELERNPASAWVPLEKLVRLEGNAKDHDIGAITESLKRWGFVDRIIINKTSGHMLAGHGRLDALQVLKTEGSKIPKGVRRGESGWLVPVDYVTVPKREEAALAIALNRLVELGGWDEPRLVDALISLSNGNLDGTGYDRDDVDQLIRLYRPELLGPEPPEPEIDRAAELQKKWGTELGQLWKIGEHRLICGDSTVSSDVKRVMDGQKAVLFATDPPYGANSGNIGFTAQRDDIEAITKDDLLGIEMQTFLETAFRAWIPHLTENTAWYLWHPMLTQGYFAAAAAAAADLIIHRQIIWVKEQFIFGRGDYHWRHELCFYGWRQGHRPEWYTERNQDTVWNIAWGEKRGAIGHPTAKPPEIFARPMRNHSRPGDICAEPFAGSGSQYIAGEQLGRRVYGSEISPAYVAVTLERLSQMGLKPKLVSV